ncbi:MAG: PorT family protein [Hymenobacter sp.]|nr:MAG: PorT family protein [Hymenobacter sp.]
MKRALFSLSSGLLLASSAHAQLGVRVGGNTTLFTAREPTANKNPATGRRLGYQVGLYYRVPLTKHLALVPEAQFSRETFHAEYTPSTPVGVIYIEGRPRTTYNQLLSYVNLPILLRASLGALYLEAGPQLSLLVGGRADNGVTGNYLTVYEAATDSYRRFDAGPCVGVGVKLPAGFGVGLRAYWGLTKLTSDENYSPENRLYTGFQHRQSLQASLTYQLPG